MKILIAGIAAVVGFSSPQVVYGHGAIHDQISALTGKIARQPSSAGLYLQRGELYRAHRDWTAALADYDRAARLDPRLDVVDLCRGLLQWDAGRPRDAKPALDRFLAEHPTHARGRVARARVLVKLGQRQAAVEDFSKAIANTPHAPPEYYLERAAALADEGQLARAISGLEEGLAALGNIITLHDMALELEVRAGWFDEALRRLERATSGLARQESALARRGEILMRAKRPAEAAQAFVGSLAAIDALRPDQRRVDAMRELETRARAGVAASTRAMKSAR